MFLEKVDDDMNTVSLRCERGKRQGVFEFGKRDRVNDGQRELVAKFLVGLRRLP